MSLGDFWWLSLALLGGRDVSRSWPSIACQSISGVADSLKQKLKIWEKWPKSFLTDSYFHTDDSQWNVEADCNVDFGFTYLILLSFLVNLYERY